MNKIASTSPFDFLVLTEDGGLVLSIGTSSDRKAVAALVSAVSIMAKGIVGSSYVKSNFEGLVITAVRENRYIYALVTPPNVAFSEEDLLDALIKVYIRAPRSSVRLVIWEILSEAKMLRIVGRGALWDFIEENLALVSNALMLIILGTPYLLIDTDYYGEFATFAKLIREQTTNIAIMPSSITRFLQPNNTRVPAVFIGKHGEAKGSMYRLAKSTVVELPKTTRILKQLVSISNPKRRHERLKEIIRRLGVISAVILKEFGDHNIVYEDQLRSILKNQPKELVDATIEAITILRRDLADKYITREKIIEDLM